ncbi:hypothetical protein D3C85_1423290 [compost metagenome]
MEHCRRFRRSTLAGACGVLRSWGLHQHAADDQVGRESLDRDAGGGVPVVNRGRVDQLALLQVARAVFCPGDDCGTGSRTADGHQPT